MEKIFIFLFTVLLISFVQGDANADFKLEKEVFLNTTKNHIEVYTGRLNATVEHFKDIRNKFLDSPAETHRKYNETLNQENKTKENIKARTTKKAAYNECEKIIERGYTLNSTAVRDCIDNVVVDTTVLDSIIESSEKRLNDLNIIANEAVKAIENISSNSTIEEIQKGIKTLKKASSEVDIVNTFMKQTIYDGKYAMQSKAPMERRLNLCVNEEEIKTLRNNYARRLKKCIRNY